jgi:hypothetical protein
MQMQVREHLSIFLAVCLPFCLPTVYPSMRLSVYLPIHLSIYILRRDCTRTARGCLPWSHDHRARACSRCQFLRATNCKIVLRYKTTFFATTLPPLTGGGVGSAGGGLLGPFGVCLRVFSPWSSGSFQPVFFRQRACLCFAVLAQPCRFE